MIEIVDPGPGATVQDLGRRGHAEWGIPTGGAADRGSLRLANRLVGNPEGAAAFEVLLGGLSFHARTALLIAVTGAPAPLLLEHRRPEHRRLDRRLDRRRAGRLDGPQWIPAGTTVSLAPPDLQLRSYVAVRGGLDSESILGSRSVDEPSGIGHAVRAGDTYAIGTGAVGTPTVDQAPRPGRPIGPVVLSGIAGPRDDWFDAESLTRFGRQAYAVLPASDRVGVRLSGSPLVRGAAQELLSEPTLRGAVEVPADGLPIVFGADHPTTCGYPVIAVLDPSSADHLSQCRPGQAVTFRLRRPEVRLTFAPKGPASRAPDPAGQSTISW